MATTTDTRLSGEQVLAGYKNQLGAALNIPGNQNVNRGSASENVLSGYRAQLDAASRLNRERATPESPEEAEEGNTLGQKKGIATKAADAKKSGGKSGYGRRNVWRCRRNFRRRLGWHFKIVKKHPG